MKSVEYPRNLLSIDDLEDCFSDVVKWAISYKMDEEAQRDFKPLDGMGGTSIYKVDDLNEDNLKIIKAMTNSEKTQIICQSFIEDVYEGDFRILIINGKPFPKTLARIPKDGDFKGNLAAGGKGGAKDITENQKKIAEAIAPILVKNEISFAGIDIVGEYLTEINITSPTCAREILDQTQMNPIEEYFKGL